MATINIDPNDPPTIEEFDRMLDTNIRIEGEAIISLSVSMLGRCKTIEDIRTRIIELNKERAARVATNPPPNRPTEEGWYIIEMGGNCYFDPIQPVWVRVNPDGVEVSTAIVGGFKKWDTFNIVDWKPFSPTEALKGPKKSEGT